MKNTTLCYLVQDGRYLLLHRIKKKQDENQGKWIGIGGKLEENESPEEACVREFWEETGLRLTDYRYRGLITFASDRWEGEYMHLFSATGAEGCLSIPNEFGVVTRPDYVKVRAQDRHGEWFEVEGHGLTARAFCHEIDHLDGVLFIDKAIRMLSPEELEQQAKG